MKKIVPFFILTALYSYSFDAFCQSEEANKKVVRRYFEEVVNQRKIELLKDIYAENYLFTNLLDGGTNQGIKQLYEFLPYMFKAVPDVRFKVDILVAENDQVVAVCTATGTHKGEFFGFPASGNTLEVKEIFIYTLKEGKIISNNGMLNLMGMQEQLKIK